MKCTVLTVGTEILFGSIVNTNAVYLSRQLQTLGIDVMYHMTVGDNPVRLKEMMAHAYLDCDMIITTGGLGPTQDDLTKEMIAEYFGERVVEWPEQTEILKSHFKGRPMTDNNRKQAWFPEHCTVLKNPNGTAPGFWMEKDGKIVISMPGPPSEMQPMFENEVRPRLLALQNSVLFYKDVRTCGIGESQLETELLDLIDGQTDPTLATYAGTFQCSLRVASKRPTLQEAQQAVEDTMVQVRSCIGQYIYSEEGEELPAVVFHLLQEKGLRLSSCESCTGGMFAAAITDIAGSSEVFDRSLVTYCNKAKMEELGVRAETLDTCTAVSRETACEMAEGLYRVTGSDLCISVTGYAGPGGGTEEDPVGTFYVGLWYQGKVEAFRFSTRRPSRDRVRKNAVLQMFRLLYEKIK
ncbi:MAG: competence/damage-inducible protein A [Firmicutes bacterium]|nr:competence/damage-inducible protein A [Bacillota bacterium]